MSDDLLERVDDGVAVLTLNRPDRLNAMSRPMLTDLVAALTRIADDGAIGAVVLTGTPPGFCAGGDVKAMADGGLNSPGDRQASGNRAAVQWPPREAAPPRSREPCPAEPIGGTAPSYP